MPGFDLRIAVLHIDRDTDLPLHYTYEAGERTFRTMGYVRLEGYMVPLVEHAGPDTPTERDRFLLKVLHSVLVPEGAARRIVRAADHLSDTGRPAGPATAHDGDRAVALLALWGLVAGLVAGVAVGGLLAGWTGAVIGAFVGASTFADLVAACWQLVHRNSPSVVIETHDLLAIAMVAGGSVVGGVIGYLLGPPGFGQAWGVFLGMSVAAFALGLVATTFSMAPFRARSMMWLGPLVVGAFAWLSELVWSHPIGLALGVVVGSLVARVPARRIAESGP